jgi:hypothetical protein
MDRARHGFEKRGCHLLEDNGVGTERPPWYESLH